MTRTMTGYKNIVGCCKCSKMTPYHIVKGLWVNIEKNKLFHLLGPNGAGQTTTINYMTGITPITIGDTLIYEHSIKRIHTFISSIGKTKTLEKPQPS